ncbi:MAG TPA: metal ABC transporter permease [Candidatus Limnocylindrales bacterium]|nr:metal ABC transporter permease [Candidatus Limnocylindrales bacterium]
MAAPTILLLAPPYFGWDVVRDLQELFRYPFMQHAYAAATLVAIVAGAIGYFVVLRGSSFAAHALSHIGFAGATGAVLLGVSPLAGLLVFTGGAGAAMGWLGGRRLRGQDVVIGIVLAWTLGLGVLFIALYSGNVQAAFAILFGEILGISVTDVQVTAIAAAITVVALAVLYRPLLFASVDEEVAEARGVPVQALSIIFMLVLAVAVSEAVQVVGVLLIFSLIVTPAAIAERLVARPLRALILSAALALLFAWSGLTIAYYLPYPVSFFITSIAFFSYLAVRGVLALRGRAAV